MEEYFQLKKQTVPGKLEGTAMNAGLLRFEYNPRDFADKKKNLRQAISCIRSINDAFPSSLSEFHENPKKDAFDVWWINTPSIETKAQIIVWAALSEALFSTTSFWRSKQFKEAFVTNLERRTHERFGI